MSETQFTPGPWTVEIDGTLTGIWAEVAQPCEDPETGQPWNRELFRSATTHIRRQDAYGDTAWASFGEAPEQYQLTEDGAEHIANANLIAAAPELYEALEALRRATLDDRSDISAARSGAAAALLKARGEQS